MWRTLAVLGAAVTAIFLTAHILVPAPPAKLYVAVVDNALDAASSETLQRAIAAEFNIPEGRRGGVLVDANFNLSTDGLSKLQTLLSSHNVDVVIAGRTAFAQLAGYGYFVPMTSQLSATQRANLRDDLTMFSGYDDSDQKDDFYDGSGHGVARSYGLRLTSLHTWSRFGPSTPDLFMGVAQGSHNQAEIQRLIAYVTRP